jgi:tetratricopeptide (TPR) repeat protein
MSAASFIRRVFLVAALGASVDALGAPLPATDPQPETIVATQLLARVQKDALRHLAGTTSVSEPSQRLAAARRMIETGRANGDPRTLGYAESILAPWPADAADAPLEAIVLHATIAQSRHSFARARALLDRVAARSAPGDPAFAQALLTRATIAQVTGGLGPARADCERLYPLAREVAAICAASVDMLGGRVDKAIPVLRVASERTSGNVRAWALAALAQAYEQRGESAAAAAAYQAAIGAGDDLVTRLAYADFLLAQGSADAVATLLRGAPPTDGVVLRQWRSARALRREDEAALRERLRTRLDDARNRGDGSDLLHARDWAQFELDLGNVAQALRLAQANWRDQREPADLLVLARAAQEARNTEARAEIVAWMKRTRLQDVRIEAALGEVRS